MGDQWAINGRSTGERATGEHKVRPYGKTDCRLNITPIMGIKIVPLMEPKYE